VTARPIAAGLSLVILSACAPGAPAGVDKAVLDDAVSRAIGDPNTCVLIAEQGSGKVVYRYNSAGACRAEWPTCEGQAVRSATALAATAAKSGAVVAASCLSAPGRTVAWAAGPIAGKPLAYAAVMEGERSFPGRMMADRLAKAFKKAGL
jgi:hypothetical protein